VIAEGIDVDLGGKKWILNGFGDIYGMRKTGALFWW
jgi:hypothetical protein